MNRQFLPRFCAELPSGISTRSAITQLIAAKILKGLTPAYTTSLRHYLEKFAATCPADLSRITPEHVQAWFAGRGEKIHSESSNLGRLQSLFGYAVRRGWLAKSPLNAMEFSRPKRSIPTIFSTAEVRRLLDSCAPDFLPGFVIAVFAGVRPEEIIKLRWRDVLLDRRLIRISAEASKVGRHRFAVLPENAVHWLHAGAADAFIMPSHSTCRRRLRRLTRAMGWRHWPKDCARHTAISNWLAATGDIGKVATAMGNSPRVIQMHYHQLVDPKDAAEFFQISPELPPVSPGICA